MPQPNLPLRRRKAARVALWIFGALPAIGVGLSGTAKFFPSTHWQDFFVGWGYPRWFAVMTGMLEVTGAILSLVPRFAFYGASLQGAVMIGAAITLQAHLGSPPGWKPTAPLVYLALFVVVAVLRWEERAR
jgi:putative oxidoreductase